MKPKKIKKETDMFAPIKALFAPKGYKVNAEVKGFDIVLSKNNEIVIIETKLNFNITLLYQAIKAQKITDLVYIAVPTQNHKKIYDISHIATSLNLGLVFVTISSANIIIEPQKNTLYTNHSKKAKLKKEIAQRKFDTNKGGTNRAEIITAYREKCLQIAATLKTTGATSPANLVKQGCPTETRQILYTNTYGWFVHVARAKYDLSSKGTTALTKSQYKQIIDYYTSEI